MCPSERIRQMSVDSFPTAPWRSLLPFTTLISRRIQFLCRKRERASQVLNGLFSLTYHPFREWRVFLVMGECYTWAACLFFHCNIGKLISSDPWSEEDWHSLLIPSVPSFPLNCLFAFCGTQDCCKMCWPAVFHQFLFCSWCFCKKLHFWWQWFAMH